jgi:hypothetical protein
MRLTGAALALRTVHVAVATVELAALGDLWFCALTNRRGKALWVAVAVLALEGVGLVVGRGDCPLGPLQERVGDPVPLFELVLPPRAAKAAVPVLASATFLGIGVLLARSRTSRDEPTRAWVSASRGRPRTQL